MVLPTYCILVQMPDVDIKTGFGFIFFDNAESDYMFLRAQLVTSKLSFSPVEQIKQYEVKPPNMFVLMT